MAEREQIVTDRRALKKGVEFIERAKSIFYSMKLEGTDGTIV